jgi:hypothetical protein
MCWRRLLSGVAACLASSLALSSCGGGDSDHAVAKDSDNAVVKGAKTSATEDSPATAPPVILPGLWPLTGEALEGDVPAHPVYVVKIDNTSSSAPQVGLGSADMVVEELVEGGLTRLAVFYDSSIPSVVGPVRSMRASDVGIVKPASALLVASGAARRTTRVLRNHHGATVTEGTGPGFYRDTGRAVPYNLFMRLPELGRHLGPRWSRPVHPYMRFGSHALDSVPSSPVRSMAVTFSGGHTTDWRHTNAGWVRPGSYATSGDDFVADNVLLLRVKIGDAGYLDPAGNPVPETVFSGTGPAVLVHGDAAVRCTWTKRDKAGELRLATKHGQPLGVPPGRTWIELVPADTGALALHP